MITTKRDCRTCSRSTVLLTTSTCPYFAIFRPQSRVGLAESPGRQILYQGRTFKVYRGMGSIGAMVKGSSERYRQSNSEREAGKLVPEGVEGRVPFKGHLGPFVYQMVGGLKAGMGYCGTRTIQELRTESRFIKVSPASVRESHPHDIAITQEAPNYSPDNPGGGKDP